MKSLAICLLFCIIISGCSIKHYNSGFKTENGYKSESGTSLLSPPESSQDIARAELIASQARINNAIAGSIKANKTISNQSGVIGVIHNINAKKAALVKDPFSDQIRTIQPGDNTILSGPTIPDTIFVLYPGNNRFESRKIFKKIHYFNTIKMDFGAMIY